MPCRAAHAQALPRLNTGSAHVGNVMARCWEFLDHKMVLRSLVQRGAELSAEKQFVACNVGSHLGHSKRAL